MRAYSMDLRERVLAAVDRTTPRKEVVRTLGVSEPTIRRYLRLRRETGSVAPMTCPPETDPATMRVRRPETGKRRALDEQETHPGADRAQAARSGRRVGRGRLG